MAKQSNLPIEKVTSKIKRKGVHAKTKTSSSKSSKSYVKPYKGQGK